MPIMLTKNNALFNIMFLGVVSMDKIELSLKDVEMIFEWNENHKDLVRCMPSPIEAIEIILTYSNYRVKGFRRGNNLKIHLSENYKGLGNMEFKVRFDGMLSLKKGKLAVDNDVVSSVITLYCALMALLTYSKPEKRDSCEIKHHNKQHSAREQKDKKPSKNVTYVLRKTTGGISVAASGSHSSPNGVFSVRGHYRHYKTGKVVWVPQYSKGEGRKIDKTYKIGD